MMNDARAKGVFLIVVKKELNTVNKSILITGGSGLIGKRLTDFLLQAGYRVVHLSRSARPGKIKTYLWDIAKQTIDPDVLNTVDVIVHLAGAGIGDKPWSKKRKSEILTSRTESARLLYNELRKGKHSVKAFISASGISYYGLDDRSLPFKEDDHQAAGFLPDVVFHWEKAADQIATLGIRVVKIRTGIVLSEKGGMLPEIMRPIRFYVGASLGSGRQPLSWIHLDDLCNIYIKAIEDENMQGVYNAVAPNPVTNKEFTHALAKTMNKPIILPSVPPFVIKFLLHEMADLVLKGITVSPDKILASGFQFKFNTVEEALNDLLPHNE
jgi:uncharacterized protein (TIGR01777 family)